MIVLFLCAIVSIIVYFNIAIDISVEWYKHIIQKTEAIIQLTLLTTSTMAVIFSLFLLAEYLYNIKGNF